MKLTGSIRIIRCIKPTKAKFFRDLQANDTIELSMIVKAPGRNRSLYATYISLICVRSGETTNQSLSELSNRLESFEYEQI